MFFIYSGFLRNKRLSAVLLILSAAVIFAGVFFVQDARAGKDGDAPETVRVGYYENEIFQEGASKDAIKKGYAYEYYGKLSEYTGWKYEYVYGSYSDLYQELIDGKIDLLAGLAWKKEREGLFYYPHLPMGNEPYTLIKHSKTSSITEDPSTFNERKIGVLDSAMVDVLHHYLDKHHVSADVVLYSDYDKLLTAFGKEKFDILALEGDAAYTRQNTYVLGTFGSSDYYLCVNRKRPDLLETLNTAQNELAIDEPYFLESLHVKFYPTSISSRAFSDSEKEWISSHDKLRVGYLENYLPYSSTDKDGQVHGIIKDLMPRLLRGIGLDSISVSFRGYRDYSDMIADVNKGKIDVAFPVSGGLYYSEENGIYQSTPVLSSTTELVYKDHRREIKDGTFAINSNNRIQLYFMRSYYPDAEVVTYPTIEDCLDAVLDGKADYTLLNGLRANDILKNSRYDGLSLQMLGKADEHCLGVKIGNEGLLRLLNKGLRTLGSDYAQNLASRYAGELSEYTTLDMVKEHLLFFGVLILAVGAFVITLLIRDRRRTRQEMAEKESARKLLESKNAQLAESQEALGKALADAENANRSKSSFLSHMSHEIRTPITAILGMNEMIQREAVDRPILEYSTNIRKAGNSLLGIINNILDFSKIEAGHMELILTSYSLEDILTDLYSLIQFHAEEKGLAFDIVIDENVPVGLVGDELRLKQILTNLLTNAIKYTEKGFVRMEIELDSRTESEAILNVSIADSGIGIRPEDLQKLFSAFGRLDQIRTRKIEGTGLGLVITQQMLVLMDSELVVESTYEVGSRFSFRLKQQISEDHPIGDFDPSVSAGQKLSRPVGAAFIAPECHILAIDDTEMNLQVIKGLLKRTRMQVDTVISGDEGIEKFGENAYDLVFLDYRMPGLDGIETLQKLYRYYPDKSRRTPIISLTASAIRGDREKLLASGFTDYLSKPVNVEELEQMLIHYLPEDKVTLLERQDGSRIPASEEDTPTVDPIEAELAKLPKALFAIPALDPKSGLEYCGSAEDYMLALKIYHDAMDKKIEMIESLLRDKDIDAYTIQVHALKSSSLTIGSLPLFEHARMLEVAAMTKDVRTLEKETPLFLKRYRVLQPLLAYALGLRG